MQKNRDIPPAIPPSPELPPGLSSEWVNPHEISCPTCDYNLAMLRMPRCPECGGNFRWQNLLRIRCPRCDASLATCAAATCPHCRLALDWQALLDSAALQDRRLYEYSPTPVRSGVAALWQALNPVRFWHRLPLETPPATRRLRALRRAAWTACAAGLGLVIGLGAVMDGWFDWREALLFVLLISLLPLVTQLALPRFQPTLGRFRVRRDQLLRVLAYAGAAQFWTGVAGLIFFLIAIGYNATQGTTGWRQGDWVTFDPREFWSLILTGEASYWSLSSYFQVPLNIGLGLVVLVLIVLWWPVFLYVGLRRFLRLDAGNSWALLLSTQLIGVLLLVLIALWLAPARSHVMRLLTGV